MPRLQRLILSENSITELEKGSFEPLETVEEIRLDRNELVTVPAGTFRQNRRLRTLVLAHNHLRHVNGLLSELPSLLSADLGFNYLLSVGNSAFTGTRELRSLDLQHNVLYEIANDAFKPLQKLSRLQLSHNFLSRVTEETFQHNIALAELHLDNNMIRSIDSGALKGTPKLRKLKLESNLLREVVRELFAGQVRTQNCNDKKATTKLSGRLS